MRTPLLIAVLFLVGCPYIPEGKYDDEVRDFDGDGVISERFGGEDCRDNDPKIRVCDADGDGFLVVAAGGDDCDDDDPEVNPDAAERCNDIDDDCDNLIDDDDDEVGGAPIWYADDDGDGYGDPAETFQVCTAPPNTIADDRDCDDGNPEIKPGATEFCDDIDRNCDGDLHAGAVDPVDFYADNDGDLYGFGPVIATQCVAPAGAVSENTDCDDEASTAFPGAPEIWYDGIDQDCLGGTDFDQDGDGHDAVPAGPDCDDLDATLSPDAPEICDGGIDNDCDGVADNDDPSVEALGQWIYYLDADGDAVGDDLSATSFCPSTAPAGWVLIGGDCDDSIDSVLPGGVEVCDTLDNDCDGVVDDGAIGQVEYYLDNDGDGYGDASVLACDLQAGYAAVDGDCNDADPAVYPGAPEVCGDAFRQDCSALSIFDCDSDGHEDVAEGGDDCDDSRADVSPTANEVCDGVDNLCNGLVDDQDPLVDLDTIANWFADLDEDGYGNPNDLVLADACAPVPGAAANAGDCDDNDPNTYPGALEICDLIDNTCEGDIDEGPITDPIEYYLDSDGDTYGNPAIVSALGCDPPADGNTWVTDDQDCHDGQPTVNPLADEICDSLDNDCDDLIDEADPSATLPTWYRDDDGDGYGQTFDTMSQCTQPSGFVPLDADCNDFEPTANPGATEICDGGIDNDCDGLGDDADPDLDTATTWYPDADGDGYGETGAPLIQCIQPAGYTNNDFDCDDADPTISPAALELCDGGVDNDCDGFADDNDPGTVNQPIWFEDFDADGWGSTVVSMSACVLPSGFLPQSGDCDDTRADINPAAPEVCDTDDNDCDGLIDDTDTDAVLTVWFNDADGDGYGSPADTLVQCTFPGPTYSLDSQDCNDLDPTINPDGSEVCDLLDNDCDGLLDDADPDVTGVGTWYADMDGDGYGDDQDLGVQACLAPPMTSSNNGDCEDTIPSANPSVQIEFCNGIDDDCDGLLDDLDGNVVNTTRYYIDFDGDGYGDNLDPGVEKCSAPTGSVAVSGDCDDFNSSIKPTASEVCNSVDDDCDGFVDDEDSGLNGAPTWYPDLDDDNFGDPNAPVNACLPGAGFTIDDTDCDDLDRDVNPNAPEICNGIDDDCDGMVDDADVVIGAPTWWLDMDGDGFGDTTFPSNKCAQPTGSVSNEDDCDDTDGTINPLAIELCDGFDNNCDGNSDDDDPGVFGAPMWWADTDNDGFGDPLGVTANACNEPPGAADNNLDCNDGAILINPGASEVCDLADNDCNDLIDEVDPGLTGATTYYFDADADTYGGADLSMDACAQPAGWSTFSNDCDDLNPAVNILALEVCDGVDNDCQGDIDDADINVDDQQDWYLDGDGDGFGGAINVTLACFAPANNVANADDCNDINPAINPYAAEICDLVDNNCDGNIDGDDPAVVGQTYFADADNDTYGDPLTPIVACIPAAGRVSNSTDCDDTNDKLYPGQTLTVGLAGADFTGIQTAMTAACNNGIIQVFPGNWAENIDFNGKALKVEGIDADNPPVLNPLTSPVVTAESGEPAGTALANIVIAPPVLAPSGGAGVRVGSGSTMSFDDVLFVDNLTSGRGGAINIQGANVDIQNCTFLGGLAALDGGAIFASGSSVLIVSTAFINNQASIGFGGAIEATNGGDLTIVGGYFDTNTSAVGGGAVNNDGNNTLSIFGGEFDSNSGNEQISVLESDATIDDVTVFNGGSGGLWVSALLAPRTLVLTRSTFYANAGIGLDVNSSNLTATITNTGTYGNGNGMSVSSPNTVLTNITSAHNSGVGLFIAHSMASVDNGILYGNGVNMNGAGVFSGPVTNTLFEHAGEVATWGGSNISGNPAFLTHNNFLPMEQWELRIRPSSPAFDTGNPALFDTNGSQSDMGMHGGSNGEGNYYNDHDFDSLVDGWEIAWFGDTSNYDAFDDPDGDGFDNLSELAAGTDPTNPDTDDDQVNDLADVAPLDPTAQ